MKQLRGIELKRFKRSLPKPRYEIVFILENIQYARNVASLFRTADAAKVKSIYLTGISKRPPFGKELQKASRQKETSVNWKYFKTTGKAIDVLRRQSYYIVALEMTTDSINISQLAKQPHKTKLAIVLGSEVHGITKTTLANIDRAIYIPMFGKGASLNVGVAGAIALYHLILTSQS